LHDAFARDGSLNVKRWSAARDVFFPVISSGKSLMMLLIYSIMVTITFPFTEKSKIIPRQLWTFLWWVAMATPYFLLSILQRW